MDDQMLFKAMHQQKLYQTAFALSVTALLSVFIFPVFIPTAVGSVALILNELAKGAADQVIPSARKTVIMSSLAIGISIGLLIFIIVSFAVVLRDPALRQEANERMFQLYGYTLEEVLQGWGINL